MRPFPTSYLFTHSSICPHLPHTLMAIFRKACLWGWPSAGFWEPGFQANPLPLIERGLVRMFDKSVVSAESCFLLGGNLELGYMLNRGACMICPSQSPGHWVSNELPWWTAHHTWPQLVTQGTKYVRVTALQGDCWELTPGFLCTSSMCRLLILLCVTVMNCGSE